VSLKGSRFGGLTPPSRAQSAGGRSSAKTRGFRGILGSTGPRVPGSHPRLRGMDAPPIQYARTEDGVNIAWWEIGTGPAVLFLNAPSKSNSELLWSIPEAAQFLDRLGARRRLVGFDWRGTGLSDRDPLDFTIDTLQRDVAAVIQYAGLEIFSLLAQEYAACVGIAYAAARPTEVHALAIWNGHLAYVDNQGAEGASLFGQAQDIWFEGNSPADHAGGCHRAAGGQYEAPAAWLP